MTWYEVDKVLPPCDGVYEIKNVIQDIYYKRKCEYTELSKYNGLTFSGSVFASHWRYPVVENIEKKYGVQK